MTSLTNAILTAHTKIKQHPIILQNPRKHSINTLLVNKYLYHGHAHVHMPRRLKLTHHSHTNTLTVQEPKECKGIEHIKWQKRVLPRLRTGSSCILSLVFFLSAQVKIAAAHCGTAKLRAQFYVTSWGQLLILPGNLNLNFFFLLQGSWTPNIFSVLPKGREFPPSHW